MFIIYVRKRKIEEGLWIQCSSKYECMRCVYPVVKRMLYALWCHMAMDISVLLDANARQRQKVPVERKKNPIIYASCVVFTVQHTRETKMLKKKKKEKKEEEAEKTHFRLVILISYLKLGC